MPQQQQQRSPSPARSNSRAPYSKRHASFNSPREVPLPSPKVDSFFFSRPVDHSPAVSPQHTPLPIGHRRPQDPPAAAAAPQLQRPPMNITLSQEDSLIASRRRNHTRQPSLGTTPPPPPPPLPDAPAAPADPTFIFPARPASLAESYSLSYSHAAAAPAPHAADRNSSSSLPLPSQIPFHTLPNAADPPSAALRCPSVNSEENSSSGSSSSSRSNASVASSASSLSPTEKPPLADESHHPRTESHPVPRPISPFRAPRPPPPQPRAPALEGTAMRRYMTPSQLQSASPLAPSVSAAAMALLASDTYPPPDPPTILPPDPSHDVMQAPEVPNQAPYMPFLSHVLPPPDSWIQVETTNTEYKLLVRLPGFSREGITLATKRRRILHIVADSWENGGGHFERRISFGYDADLVQVRAEFDGIMLRIVIPRRVSPITWNANAVANPRMGRV